MKMITRVSFFVCLLYMALVNAKLNRIVGGTKSHPGQFKYQILLKDTRERICGAAIIADQYVLTAAHCVIDNHDTFQWLRLHVIAGSTNVYSNQGVRIDVEKSYVPSIYRSTDKKNDIAVLKLRWGLGLGSNSNLEKINLPPNRESSYVGHTAVISGYGWIHVDVRINPITQELEEFNGYTDGKLRYAMTNIISNEECTQKNQFTIDENQICAQPLQRKGQSIGVCTGDSGGPLVSGNIIIGVASISPTGCKEDTLAAVYTRVSSFIGFITKAMNDAKTSDMLVGEFPSMDSSSSSKRHGKCKWMPKGTVRQ